MSKSPPWETLLLRRGGKSSGMILPCVPNLATIFAHDTEWRGVLAYDESIGDIVSLKEPPWPSDMAPDKVAVGSWTIDDTRLACMWVTRKYNFPPTTPMVGEGLCIAARRVTRHPLRDWLNDIKWDRKARLDTFLIRLAGADDTPYVRAVSKNFLIGAVARVFQPGAKVDSMPILEGDQGIGKSSLVRELAGEQNYLESTVEIGHKDGYQVLRKKWIVELGELDSLTKAEVSRAKQFLTQRVDTYRPSYGQGTADFYRQCVFVGTVNPNGGGYLKDETGARRFWPIYLRKILLELLRREREQLWAEAVLRYRRCEKWHFDDAKLITAAKEEAEDRRQQDPWEAEINGWLTSLNADATKRGVTTSMLLDRIPVALDRRMRTDEMRAAAVLRACGWSDVYRDEKNPSRPRYYRRPDWEKIVATKRPRTPTSEAPKTAKVIDMQTARKRGRPSTLDNVSRDVSRPQPRIPNNPKRGPRQGGSDETQ